MVKDFRAYSYDVFAGFYEDVVADWTRVVGSVIAFCGVESGGSHDRLEWVPLPGKQGAQRNREWKNAFLSGVGGF